MNDGKILLKTDLYGYDICAEITLLKEDIHVLLTGGCLSHTGAVSMYFNGRLEGTIQPEGHKDQLVSDIWGKQLSEKFSCRVTVVCGIHYDDLKKNEIRKIVLFTEELLEKAVGEIGKLRELKDR